MVSSSNVSTSISSIYSNVQVPLFEGENYDFWAVKMETLFTSLDVLKLVKEGYEELAATTEATATQHEELKKKKNHRCWSSRHDSKRSLNSHISKNYEGKNSKASMGNFAARVRRRFKSENG